MDPLGVIVPAPISKKSLFGVITLKKQKDDLVQPFLYLSSSIILGGFNKVPQRSF